MEGIFWDMHFSNISKQADRYLKDRQSICVTVYNMLGFERETTTKKTSILRFTCTICNSWTSKQQLNTKKLDAHDWKTRKLTRHPSKHELSVHNIIFSYVIHTYVIIAKVAFSTIE